MPRPGDHKQQVTTQITDYISGIPASDEQDFSAICTTLQALADKLQTNTPLPENLPKPIADQLELIDEYLDPSMGYVTTADYEFVIPIIQNRITYFQGLTEQEKHQYIEEQVKRKNDIDANKTRMDEQQAPPEGDEAHVESVEQTYQRMSRWLDSQQTDDNNDDRDDSPMQHAVQAVRDAIRWNNQAMITHFLRNVAYEFHMNRYNHTQNRNSFLSQLLDQTYDILTPWLHENSNDISFSTILKPSFKDNKATQGFILHNLQLLKPLSSPLLKDLSLKQQKLHLEQSYILKRLFSTVNEHHIHYKNSFLNTILKHQKPTRLTIPERYLLKDNDQQTLSLLKTLKAALNKLNTDEKRQLTDLILGKESIDPANQNPSKIERLFLAITKFIKAYNLSSEKIQELLPLLEVEEETNDEAKQPVQMI